MNTRQKEFFVERLLHFVLDVAVPWFIMVITYTPKKGLETSKSEDTSVQIVTAHLKKTVVSGRVLSLFFLIRLMISSNYSDLKMFHMKEFLPLWILYIQDQNLETIQNFLKKHLDTSEPVFIVTDFDKRYPEILSEVFGDKLVHQYCLMHLNKLVAVSYTHLTLPTIYSV